ncbi:MAG: YSC84-related protein, partial [Verrucomicrobiota bacterium]
EESLSILKDGGAGGAGINLQAVAGPYDAGSELGPGSLQQPVLVYSNARGAFIGASLSAGAIVDAKRRNSTFYGLTMEQVLFGGTARMSPAGQALSDFIQMASGFQPSAGTGY